MESQIELNNDVVKDLLKDSEQIIEACIKLPQMNDKISFFEKRKSLNEQLILALNNEITESNNNVLKCRNALEIFELQNTIKILENTIHNNNQRKAKIEDTIESVAPYANEFVLKVLTECLIIAKKNNDLPRISMFEPILNSEQWKEFDSHELVAMFIDSLKYKALHI